MPVRFAEMGRTFEHEGNEMKKVLLASTALAFSAGMAAAQGVSLSGYAEIGVGGTDASNSERFHTDMDVTFTLSGETDAGLAFGATIDLDEVSGGIGPDDGLTKSNPGTVFVSGDFGTITIGDTDGAFDWAMLEVGWGTSIADDHTTHAGFSGNSGLDGSSDRSATRGQVARYDNSFGDFSFALSAEISDGSSTGDDIVGVGFKYQINTAGAEINLGLGYQTGDYRFGVGDALQAAAIANGFALSPDTGTTDFSYTLAGDADIVGVSAELELDSGFSVRLNYSNLDGDFDTIVTTTTFTSSGISFTGSTSIAATPLAVEWDHYAIGVAYAVDNWLVEANWGEFDGTVSGGGVSTPLEADGYGIAFNYDLGGGAVVMVGYGSGTGFGATTSSETWSAGLGLSF